MQTYACILDHEGADGYPPDSSAPIHEQSMSSSTGVRTKKNNKRTPARLSSPNKVASAIDSEASVPNLSEEDLKIKVLLPWLTSLGFGSADIHFEYAFDLQVGENAIRIGSGKSTKARLHARADILVKTSDGKNLLIVELKNPSEPLTTKARDQAISYACLLKDGIAPFCIVSNGKETHCYDSITRNQITDPHLLSSHSFVANGRCVTGLSIAHRYEAVLLLLSLSSDNLMRFCEVQVRRRMRVLRGEDPFCGKKYIPSLHIPRTSVEEKVLSLLESEKRSIVLLVGDPQVGKTNILCHIAEQCIAASRPCLFYPAIGLRGGLIEEIAADLSWQPGGEEAPRSVIGRALKTLKAKHSRLLIIIDGWNEVSDELARRIDQDYSLLDSESVQLLVSFTCSSSRRLLCDEVGNPTNISDRSLPTRDGYKVLESSSNDVPSGWPAVNVGKYTDAEFQRAYRIYSEIYRTRIPVEHSYVRDPLLLRIAMEAFSGRSLPQKLDEPSLLRRSIEAKCERARAVQVETGMVYLQVLAETISQVGAPAEIRAFASRAGQPAVYEIPQGLFDAALFARVRDIGVHGAIDFYSHRERSYAIAYLARRWVLGPDSARAALRDGSLLVEPVADAYTWFLIQSENWEHFVHVASSLQPDNTPAAWRAVISAALEIGQAALQRQRYGDRRSISRADDVDANDAIADIAKNLMMIGLKTSDSSIWFHAVKLFPLTDLEDDIAADPSEQADRLCSSRELLSSILELDRDHPFVSSTYGQVVLSTLRTLHDKKSEEGWDSDTDLARNLTELCSHSDAFIRGAAFRCLGHICPWALSRALSWNDDSEECPDYIIDALCLTCDRLRDFLYGDICPGMLSRLEDDPAEASYYYDGISELESFCSLIQDERLNRLRAMLGTLKKLASDWQDSELYSEDLPDFTLPQEADVNQLSLFEPPDDEAE